MNKLHAAIPIAFLGILAFTVIASGCSSMKNAGNPQPDPEKVHQASIMTNKCLLNHHDIPGSLVARQECLNKASGLLMDGYGAEIQNVARLCAQKLTQIATDADTGQIDLKTYQDRRDLLKIECAEAAKAASARKP